MKAETSAYLKDLFEFLSELDDRPRKQGRGENESGLVSIPIVSPPKKPIALKIHFSVKPKCGARLNDEILSILGGPTNIENIKSIPESRRIRVTIKDPSRLKEDELEKANIRFYIRVGPRIIHIVP